MNKATAKRIAQSGQIAWGELQQTLKRAFDAGAANETRGKVNKGLSRASSYTILGNMAKGYAPACSVDPKNPFEWLGAQNILREFGDFWEGWQPEPEPKRVQPEPLHKPAVEIPF
ncbi:MAG TPA: hypothetical protein VM163_02710 [bacterium]|nr:hypothetical protein [bacterium]